MPVPQILIQDTPKMEYIKLYGKPENDEYDTVKLEQIIRKLNFVYHDNVTYVILC